MPGLAVFPWGRRVKTLQKTVWSEDSLVVGGEIDPLLGLHLGVAAWPSRGQKKGWC